MARFYQVRMANIRLCANTTCCIIWKAINKRIRYSLSLLNLTSKAFILSDIYVEVGKWPELSCYKPEYIICELLTGYSKWSQNNAEYVSTKYWVTSTPKNIQNNIIWYYGTLIYLVKGTKFRCFSQIERGRHINPNTFGADKKGSYCYVI